MSTSVLFLFLFFWLNLYISKCLGLVGNTGDDIEAQSAGVAGEVKESQPDMTVVVI